VVNNADGVRSLGWPAGAAAGIRTMITLHHAWYMVSLSNFKLTSKFKHTYIYTGVVSEVAVGELRYTKLYMII